MTAGPPPPPAEGGRAVQVHEEGGGASKIRCAREHYLSLKKDPSCEMYWLGFPHHAVRLSTSTSTPLVEGLSSSQEEEEEEEEE